jgi:type VI secretion system protein ImpA
VTIDLDKLLAPIAEAAPTGTNLRDAADDATFALIDDLRREIDPAVDDAGVGKAANWPAVQRACEQALSTRSKDLQLAAYLTEALAQVEGFAGLHAGLQFVRALLESHWEALHPGAGEGGVDVGVRGRWLSWLSSPKGLIPSIRAVRFIGESAHREERMPWDAFLEAQFLDEAAASSQERYQELIAGGAVTRERWNKAVGATKPAELRAELDAVRACESELLALDRVCEARFESDDAPSFVELRGLLSDIREFLEGVVGGDAVATGSGVSSAAGAVGVRAAAPAGPVGSRQDALRRLAEVADFFRQTEPHSPLPHLIDRAVRWAGMSFEELLLDVMKSNDALTPVWDTLGIKPRPPDEGA